MSCFLALHVLRAQFGEDLPYVGALDRRFAFRGQRIPFLNRMKGIHRASAQRGPAALSVQTSAVPPYEDVATEEGFAYAYRAGDVEQADNRALRAAHALGVPIVYFMATRPGWYHAVYPVFVTDDNPVARFVVLSPGEMVGPLDEQEPEPIVNSIERRYRVRETKVRLHQARFRGLVLPAYSDRCAICRLHELRLLDAAHIVGDAHSAGAAEITNGLSLCTIHHRAFDNHLVGVTADYEVRISPRLLDDDDGPMLDVLKQFHRVPLTVPRSAKLRPDRERLALRYEQFVAAS